MTHDYTHRRWGHDFTIMSVGGPNGQVLHACGWGRGIHNGDFLILPNGGSTTRYSVSEIDYYLDPPDMWTAVLAFAPRQGI